MDKEPLDSFTPALIAITLFCVVAWTALIYTMGKVDGGLECLVQKQEMSGE